MSNIQIKRASFLLSVTQTFLASERYQCSSSNPTEIRSNHFLSPSVGSPLCAVVTSGVSAGTDPCLKDTGY